MNFWIAVWPYAAIALGFLVITAIAEHMDGR